MEIVVGDFLREGVGYVFIKKFTIVREILLVHQT